MGRPTSSLKNTTLIPGTGSTGPTGNTTAGMGITAATGPITITVPEGTHITLPHLRLSPEDFTAALAAAKRGDKIVYHVGLLMEDRLKNRELDKLATAVWNTACVGDGKSATCALVQRRLSDPFGFEYIAVKL